MKKNIKAWLIPVLILSVLLPVLKRWTTERKSTSSFADSLTEGFNELEREKAFIY